MRVPDYVTRDAITISYGFDQEKVLPAGSFVKPIRECYLPKHVTEDPKNRFFDPNVHLYVYCYYGFIYVEQKQIMEVTWR
jgi:hypothetical protein